MRVASSTTMKLRKNTIQRFGASAVLLCTLCFLSVLPLSAAQVNIFGTGVNNSNVVLAGGTQDPHWTITGTTQPAAPNSNTFVAQPCSTFGDCGSAPSNFPFNIWATSSTNAWISPFNSDTNSLPTAGYIYDFSENFDLTGFTLSSVSITLNWAADNCANIFVNGTALTSTNCSLSANQNQYSPKQPIVITNASIIAAGGTGLNASGSNTITFRVQNAPSAAPDPSGLLVEVTAATGNTGVPEPATLFGVGLGLSIVGLAYRRRRS